MCEFEESIKVLLLITVIMSILPICAFLSVVILTLIYYYWYVVVISIVITHFVMQINFNYEEPLTHKAAFNNMFGMSFTFGKVKNEQEIIEIDGY